MTAGPNGSEEETNESVKENTCGRKEPTKTNESGGNPNLSAKILLRRKAGLVQNQKERNPISWTEGRPSCLCHPFI